MLFVALVLPGAPPKADDSVARLSATLTEHRAAFVRGTVLAGAATVALLWFVAVVAASIRDADSANDAAAIAATVGGSVALVFMFAGMLLFNGVAFKAVAIGAPAVVRAAVDTGNMVIESSKLGFAVLILAVCAPTGSRSPVSPFMRRAGQVTALLTLASSIPPYFADHGIGQFGGAVDVLGGIPAFAWLLGLSIVLARA